jgi:hypothetical protein
MTLDRQTQALLALVEADRAQKCAAILDDARARCAAMLAQAHADARARMRAAFAEERARRDLRIAAAQATLQTRLRLAGQHRSATFLAAGWQRLPSALAARWSAAETRRAWIAAVVAQARSALPNATLRIAHPPDWPRDERNALAASVAREFGSAPTLVPDPSITAGLRITAGANVVDGTREGLCADRAEIGARLLHELECTEREGVA